MENQKPKALQCAEHLEQFRSFEKDLEAAAELRRQHARIQELEAMLDAVGAGGVSAQRVTQDKWDSEPAKMLRIKAIQKAADHIAQPRKMVAAQEPFGYFKQDTYGWMDCSKDTEGAIALYKAPQPQADARDAERYLFIKRKLSLIGNGDGTCSMQAVNLPARVLGWPDVGDEARLQFLDDAIDAAIAAAKEMK